MPNLGIFEPSCWWVPRTSTMLISMGISGNQKLLKILVSPSKTKFVPAPMYHTTNMEHKAYNPCCKAQCEARALVLRE